MKILTALFIIFFCKGLFAMDVTKKVVVNSIRWDENKSLYRLELHGFSGAFFADKKLLLCLKNSLEKKKEVSVTYDVHKLLINSCK